MRKKILVLMLVIPLLFIFAVYGITQAARINVEVPVSSISILNSTQNGVLAYDMAQQEEVYLQVRIYPALAKNKGYSFEVECAKDTPQDNIGVDGDTGKLIVNGVGSAKITVRSNDGGYTDSITLLVRCSKVLDFVPSVSSSLGECVELTAEGVGVYSVQLASDEDFYTFAANIIPGSLSYADIEWKSSNAAVLDITPDGTAHTLAAGESVVSAVLEDGVNGRMSKEIRVCVVSQSNEAGVIVNGGVFANVYSLIGSREAEFVVQTQVEAEIVVEGDYLATSALTELDEGIYRVHITLLEGCPDNTLVRVGIVGQAARCEVRVRFEEFEFVLGTLYDTSTDGTVYITDNGYSQFFARSRINGALHYAWNVEGDLCLREGAGAKAFVSASAGSRGVLLLEVKKDGELVATARREVECVEDIDAIVFEENSRIRGISGELAYGGVGFVGSEYSTYMPRLGLMVQTTTGLVKYVNQPIVFSVSTDNARVLNSDNGVLIEILGDGLVEVSAKWEYADYFKRMNQDSVTLKLVHDGVNVYDYKQLMRATQDKRKIVLQGDIMLGKKGATTSEIEKMVFNMPTEYDWRFYANKGQGRPNVLYLVEFFDDVYGNGYTINAEYIANARDRTGSPLLFKGPLDFVSMGNASVKAQDNISFLVRTAGVELNNVVLKSCSDESLIRDESMDLSRLNFVGTTLEINAANVEINACRISNGRTVVRIFGGGVTNGSPIVDAPSQVDVEKERASTVIDKCVLSNAREFILKVGSNRAIDAKGKTQDATSDEVDFEVARLLRKDGSEYNVFECNLNDDYFVKSYLITDVTLRDSVLFNSGIFAVGLEAHFCGEMLDGYHLLSPKYWYNLAATSFATALRLEGDVRLYDWKKLADVDSSTLIETSVDADAYLTFNIPAMLDKVYAQGGEVYKDICASIKGEKYVHGGIAVYGGGYNYAGIDMSAFEDDGMHDYRINLSILSKGEQRASPLYLQGTLLPHAAGMQDFRFLIYGADSKTNYLKQVSDFADGSAYAPIYMTSRI